MKTRDPRRWILAALVCATVWCPTAMAADAPAGDFTGSPEFKVLDRYTGTWDEEHTSVGPEKKSGKGTAVVEWVLKGRFQQLRTTSAMDDSEGLQMRTYDPKHGVYLLWWFGSAGTAGNLAGTWDELTRTMSYKSRDNGLTTTGTDRFVDDDTREVSFTVKDTTGAVRLETRYKCVRRKP